MMPEPRCRARQARTGTGGGAAKRTGRARARCGAVRSGDGSPGRRSGARDRGGCERRRAYWMPRWRSEFGENASGESCTEKL